MRSYLVAILAIVAVILLPGLSAGQNCMRPASDPNTSVCGSASFNDVTARDDLTVTDDASVGDDLTVTGDASVGGNATVTGTLTAGAIAGVTTESFSCRNETGGPLGKGDAVHVTSWDTTDVYLIELADADNQKPAHGVLNATLADATTGTCYQFIEVTGIDTSAAAAEGDEVCLTPTATTTNTWAVEASCTAVSDEFRQVLGIVTVDNAVTGAIKFDLRKQDFRKIGTDQHQDNSVTFAKLQDFTGRGYIIRGGAAGAPEEANFSTTGCVGIGDGTDFTCDTTPTFVDTLTANGAFTLGDAAADTGTINGTVTFNNATVTIDQDSTADHNGLTLTGTGIDAMGINFAGNYAVTALGGADYAWIGTTGGADLILSGGDDATAATAGGVLTLFTQAAAGANGANLQTQAYSNTTDTKKIGIFTGAQTGASGNSGVIAIFTGSSTNGTTGSITDTTGNAGGGASGSNSRITGTGTTATGAISDTTGDASAGDSGNINHETGTGTTATGSINNTTGNASAGDSGDINNTTGTATGTRGSFNVDALNANITAHIHSIGTAPAQSVCGGTPGTIVGSDNAGLVTIGTDGGGVTACTITFNATFTTTPACIITGDNSAVTYAITARSATAFTIGASADMQGDVVSYVCIGQDNN